MAAERRAAGDQFVIECWPWDGGPQFDGWPYRLPFPSAPVEHRRRIDER